MDHEYSIATFTEALKQLLDAQCQKCGWDKFTKRDGTDFIEAHHLMEIAERRSNSQCTNNIIHVCPNCPSRLALRRMCGHARPGFSKNVPLIGRADRQFWLRPSELPYSEKLNRFMGRAIQHTQPACCRSLSSRQPVRLLPRTTAIPTRSPRGPARRRFGPRQPPRRAALLVVPIQKPTGPAARRGRAASP
jgi:hypothetical protein